MNYREHYRVPIERACRRFDAWDTGGRVLHLRFPGSPTGWLCSRYLTSIATREWSLLGQLCETCRNVAEKRSWRAPDAEWNMLGLGAPILHLRTGIVHRVRRRVMRMKAFAWHTCGDHLVERDRHRLFRIPGLLGGEGFCKPCWRSWAGLPHLGRPQRRSFDLGQLITLRSGQQAIYYEPTAAGHRIKVRGTGSCRVVHDREIR